MRGLALWSLALALCTLVLTVFREALHEAHNTLAYLLIVVGASAGQGRIAGLTMAVAAFLAFNFFLLPPYYTFALDDPLDGWVLLGFLVTGSVTAELFHRVQRARATAESRAREIARFTSLAAESLAAPSAVDAVGALARVIHAELPVRSVQVVGLDGDGGRAVVIARSPVDDADSVDGDLVRFAAKEGRLLALERQGTSQVAPPDSDLVGLVVGTREHVAVMIPLRIRGRGIGVVRLAHPEGLALDRAQAVFAEALSHYAALAVERVRLAAEVEHVAALREADRLKDALIASVSHDLRTPLTTIRALASEMRGLGDERPVIIEEEADRLNRLVADLLDLSRIRAGVLPLDLQLVAAEDLVGAALQRLSGVPGGERVAVRLPADGTLPVGRMDFVQALRALGNLLENALRHSPPGQAVELEVAVEGPELAFRVLDRGPGVAENDRERLFEPFVRGTSPSRAAPGGTGLGLAIARSVAEVQGGSVCYAPRPGGGSAFVLRLPAEAVLDLVD